MNTKVPVQDVVDLLKAMLESDSLMGRITDDQAHDAWAMVTRLEKHGIEVAYTPMTYKERNVIVYSYNVGSIKSVDELVEVVEQAVLARQGVAPTLGQAKKICEANGYVVNPKQLPLLKCPVCSNMRGILRACALKNCPSANDMLEAAKEVKS
jgi:hypothetical protein